MSPRKLAACGVTEFDRAAGAKINMMTLIDRSKSITAGTKAALADRLSQLLAFGTFGKRLEDMGGSGVIRLSHLENGRRTRVSLGTRALKKALAELCDQKECDELDSANPFIVTSAMHALEIRKEDKAHVIVHLVGNMQPDRESDLEIYALANYASQNENIAAAVCSAIDAYVAPRE